MYMDFDTGETYTLEELKTLFDQYNEEMAYNDFEEFMNDQLAKGLQRVGGLIEIEQ